MDNSVAESGDYRGGGDGEDPRPDYAARNAPFDGGEPFGRADTDDRTRNGVRGRNRYAKMRGKSERQCTRRLGAESADRLELCDL